MPNTRSKKIIFSKNICVTAFMLVSCSLFNLEAIPPLPDSISCNNTYLTQLWKLNMSLWLGRQTHFRESGTAELGKRQTIQYATLANKRQAHQAIAEHNSINQTNYLIIDTTYNSVILIIVSSIAIYF